MNAQRFFINLVSCPGLQSRFQKVRVDPQIKLFGDVDDLAEQRIAAVHGRSRSEHHAAETTNAPVTRENREHHLAPRLRRRLRRRLSTLRLIREANVNFIEQPRNKHRESATS